MFRPSKAQRMMTAINLYTPTTSRVEGVITKQYKLAQDPLIYCNFATYGGTELTVDGILAVEDTAQVICWYRPDITAGCMIMRLSDSASFEIIGSPENIEQRNQIISFKVKRLIGGV